MNTKDKRRIYMNQCNAKKRVEELEKSRNNLVKMLNELDFSGFTDAPKDLVKAMKQLSYFIISFNAMRGAISDDHLSDIEYDHSPDSLSPISPPSPIIPVKIPVVLKIKLSSKNLPNTI